MTKHMSRVASQWASSTNSKFTAGSWIVLLILLIYLSSFWFFMAQMLCLIWHPLTSSHIDRSEVISDIFRHATTHPFGAFTPGPVTWFGPYYVIYLVLAYTATSPLWLSARQSIKATPFCLLMLILVRMTWTLFHVPYALFMLGMFTLLLSVNTGLGIGLELVRRKAVSEAVLRLAYKLKENQ